jgi:hypothetical protein
MLKSEFSAAIVARPSGWLTSTFRMAICRDTHNSTPQLETVSNVVLPGWVVYGPQGEAHIEKRPQRGMELRPLGGAQSAESEPHYPRTLPKLRFVDDPWMIPATTPVAIGSPKLRVVQSSVGKYRFVNSI